MNKNQFSPSTPPTLGLKRKCYSNDQGMGLPQTLKLISPFKKTKNSGTKYAVDFRMECPQELAMLQPREAPASRVDFLFILVVLYNMFLEGEGVEYCKRAHVVINLVIM